MAREGLLTISSHWVRSGGNVVAFSHSSSDSSNHNVPDAQILDEKQHGREQPTEVWGMDNVSNK